MKALLVIDMQVGMFENGTPRDVDGVLQRINHVARAMRTADGIVVFVRHDGPANDTFARGNAGWRLLASLERTEADLVVSKTTCDAFYDTELDAVLKRRRVDELFISGWATDFCVDTTIRAAASREYDVTVVSDAHTAADRAHLSAASIIRHHNLTWAEMIVPGRPIAVVPADTVVRLLSDANDSKQA